MTAPAKSALDEARERLETISKLGEHDERVYASAAIGWPNDDSPKAELIAERLVRTSDLRLVLDALKEAEQRLEQFEECQLDSDGFCTDENCNRHD